MNLNSNENYDYSHSEYSLLFFDSSFESVWKHISLSNDISWMDIKVFSDGTLGCRVEYDDSSIVGRIDTENGNITEMFGSDCVFCTSCNYMLDYDNYYELWNIGSSSPVFRSKEYDEDFLYQNLILHTVPEDIT